MDLVKYIFPGLFSIVMLYAFDIETLTKDSLTLGVVSAILLLYGWAIVPFTYLFGFIFESYGNA